MKNAAKDLIVKGWRFHQQGNLDAAADFYKKAIEFDTSNFDSWHLLGLTLIQKGMPAEAIKPLRQAVEINPQSDDARLHLGTALAQNGESEKALIQFQEAQRLNPKSPMVYLNSGLALANLSRFEEAKASFTRQLSIEPNNPMALLNLGRIESELGNSTRAIKIFQQLESTYPGEKSILLMHAQALHKANEHQTALRKIDSCLQLDTEFDEALSSKGVILRALGRLDDALTYFKRASLLSPKNPTYLGQLGALENELGDFKNSESHLRLACALSPETPEFHISLGLSLSNQGFYPEAIECYEKGLAINPESFDALNNLGTSLLKLRAHDKAENAYLKAIEIEPNSPVLLSNLAKCLNETNRSREAIDLCQRAIEIHPYKAEPYIEIAKGYSSIGQDLKAYEFLKLGLQNTGSNPVLLNNLGTSESDIGLLSDAMMHFSMSEESDPDYAEPKFNKSLIQIKQYEFNPGWKNFEYRWLTKKFDSCHLEFPCPQWTGARCEHLVVWKEQGIGDQLLFCSLLPMAQKHASKITVFLDNRLIPLMSLKHPHINFVAEKSLLVSSYFDFHIPMGSLPAIFCHEPNAIANKPFVALSAPPEKISWIDSLLGSARKPRVGIAWRSKNNVAAQAKSLELEVLLEAIDPEKLEIVNLQYGDISDEIDHVQSLKPSLRIKSYPEIDLYNDIDALSALIERCDIVLTSSNATAHFAGVLGKKAIVITPFAKGKHWYWWHTTSGGQSLWYPSLQVLSQDQNLSWRTPVQQAKGLISELMKH